MQQKHDFIKKLIYHEYTYLSRRGGFSIKNDEIEAAIDWFSKLDSLTQRLLFKPPGYIDIIKILNQEITSERNDVYIYKTILYPPKSKSPNTN